VTVAGEAEIEGQTAEILLSTSQRFEGGPQPQPGEVAMDRQAGLLSKHTTKMEGARLELASELRQAHRLTEGAAQQAPEILGEIAALAPPATRRGVTRRRESGDHDFGGHFQGGLLDLERLCPLARFQVVKERSMAQEGPVRARSRRLLERTPVRISQVRPVA
jgi:hypothetical protein